MLQLLQKFTKPKNIRVSVVASIPGVVTPEVLRACLTQLNSSHELELKKWGIQVHSLEVAGLE